MSKTQRILNARKTLLSLFNAYAFIANGWNPEDEDDYDGLTNCVDEVLEQLVTFIQRKKS